MRKRLKSVKYTWLGMGDKGGAEGGEQNVCERDDTSWLLNINC